MYRTFKHTCIKTDYIPTPQTFGLWQRQTDSLTILSLSLSLSRFLSLPLILSSLSLSSETTLHRLELPSHFELNQRVLGFRWRSSSLSRRIHSESNESGIVSSSSTSDRQVVDQGPSSVSVCSRCGWVKLSLLSLSFCRNNPRDFWYVYLRNTSVFLKLKQVRVSSVYYTLLSSVISWKMTRIDGTRRGRKWSLHFLP